MCLETANITYEETGSELLALLKESAEIKHFYPKFNRAQRRANEAVGLFSYEDQKGIIHSEQQQIILRLVNRRSFTF